jgi:hypothetical protein
MAVQRRGGVGGGTARNQRCRQRAREVEAKSTAIYFALQSIRRNRSPKRSKWPRPTGEPCGMSARQSHCQNLDEALRRVGQGFRVQGSGLGCLEKIDSNAGSWAAARQRPGPASLRPDAGFPAREVRGTVSHAPKERSRPRITPRTARRVTRTPERIAVASHSALQSVFREPHLWRSAS